MPFAPSLPFLELLRRVTIAMPDAAPIDKKIIASNIRMPLNYFAF
jgi:hypothetical protein